MSRYQPTSGMGKVEQATHATRTQPSKSKEIIPGPPWRLAVNERCSLPCPHRDWNCHSSQNWLVGLLPGLTSGPHHFCLGVWEYYCTQCLIIPSLEISKMPSSSLSRGLRHMAKEWAGPCAAFRHCKWRVPFRSDWKDHL
jgi:hypothetical protein